MVREELIDDPRFANLEERAKNGDVINGIVAEWCAGLAAAEIEKACLAYDVPVGTAYDASDIAADAHMAARGDLVTVDDPVIGPVRQQAPYPRISTAPAQPPRGAPLLGEHNDEVWGDVLSADDYAAARAAGVFG
jgi:crotonobetainyl-CoA:carnitine CoA-transferase CaiB-like acyl-CoA transferase